LNNPLKYTDPIGFGYRQMLEEFNKNNYTEEPVQFLGNNYPGGWGNYQKAIAKGSWQYYVSSSFRDLFPNSTFTTEYEYDGSPAGYWIKTTETKVVGANTPLGHYAGDVEVTRTFIPFVNFSDPDWQSNHNFKDGATNGGGDSQWDLKPLETSSDLAGWGSALWSESARTTLQTISQNDAAFRVIKGIGTGARYVGYAGIAVNLFVNGARVYNDPTWGNYGRLGVSVFEGVISISFPGFGTLAGLSVTAIGAAGGLNGFYNYLNANQQLYNNTGLICIPGNTGVPMLINLK